MPEEAPKPHVSKKLSALVGTGVAVTLLERYADMPWPTQVSLVALAAVYIGWQGWVDGRKASSESAMTWKTTAKRYQAERDALRDQSAAAEKKSAEQKAWNETYGAKPFPRELQ